MRWFLNKFPAVEKQASPKSRPKKFYSEAFSYGVHEIIVETPVHKSQLADLPVDDLKQLLKICGSRIKKLEAVSGIRYVEVFKNHGTDAGTSLLHSHTQVTALPQ